MLNTNFTVFRKNSLFLHFFCNGASVENRLRGIKLCAGALTDAGRSGLAAVVQESHVGQAVAVVHAAAPLQDLCKTRKARWNLSEHLSTPW